MLFRLALPPPLQAALLAPASRAISIWAGSLSLDSTTSADPRWSDSPNASVEVDSPPSVPGWPNSQTGGPFEGGDTGGSGGFPQLPDVSRPERGGSILEAYRLMAVPKRKISPSRNGLRFQHKWLKPAYGLIKCKGCGKVTTRHRYCSCGLISPQEAQSPQGESTS